MAVPSSLDLSGVLDVLLAERGLSQAELARRLHADPATVYRWCSGLRSVPGGRLWSLAQALEVSYQELTGLAEPPEVVALPPPPPPRPLVERAVVHPTGERLQSYCLSTPWMFPPLRRVPA